MNIFLMPIFELLEAVLPFLQGGGQEALPQGTNSLPLPSPQEGLPQGTNSLPLPSPQEGLPPGPNSPALEVGGPEAGVIIKYESMEASMANRVAKLERANSIFLLDKGKGEYWSEIKAALNNCTSQGEYFRLLFFENRDLQIRERKHECYSLFQGILSQHPALRENAAYDPTESFIDFFNEKRDALDKNPEWSPEEKDRREIQFINQVKRNLRARGPESSYMRNLLGSEEGG